MKKKIAFRCDASPEIGSGHVMRCLTLAEFMNASGWNCVFLVSQETQDTLPIFQGVVFAIGDPESFDDSVEILVVDHYGLDIKYEHSARGWAKHIMVIDDLANRSHDCDVLLDQTYGRSVSDYEGLVSDDCLMLVGAQYALLRPQFAAIRQKSIGRRKERCGKLENILVSLGSTNFNNVTGLVLSAFQSQSLPAFQICVVLGSRAPGMSIIKEQVGEINCTTPHNIELLTDVEDMATLMNWADLAIGAGGTTSWERCCLGLPTLMIEIAGNQSKIADELHRRKAVINLGKLEGLKDEHISAALVNLVRSPEMLINMQKEAFKICDGDGMKKVKEHMLNVVNS